MGMRATAPVLNRMAVGGGRDRRWGRKREVRWMGPAKFMSISCWRADHGSWISLVWSFPALDAGVVDKDVDGGEVAGRLLEQLDAVSFLACIGDVVLEDVLGIFGLHFLQLCLASTRNEQLGSSLGELVH